MATNVFARSVSFTVPGATGLQEIECPDFGDITPKAAMFILPGRTVTTVGSGRAMMSVGFTDGTRQRASTATISDAASTTDSENVSVNDALCWDFAGLGGDAVFSSFGTNIVNINWTDVPAATETREGICVLFGGTDLQAFAGTTGSLGTGAGTVAVTGVGFAPDLVFIVAVPDITDGTGTASVDALFSFGVACRLAATQHCISLMDDDNLAAPTPAVYVNDAAAITILTPTTGAIAWSGTVSAWGADGFSITTSASASNATPIFLAIKLGDCRAKSYVTTTRTAIGEQVVTDPGFIPQIVFQGATSAEAVNTTTFDTALACHYGIGVFDNALTENFGSIRNNFVEVGAVSDTENDFREVAFQAGTDTDIDNILASLVTIDPTGYTLNYTAVNASARKGFGLAIERGDIIPQRLGFTFGDFTDDSFEDWSINSDVGADFSSYLNTFFQAAEDQMYFMQAPYVYIHLENQDPNTAEDPTLTESLFFRGAWDWSNSAASKHWSREAQVYNYRQNNLVSVARRKVRGRGRVLQMRFYSDPGKDFKLFGWSIPLLKNSDP